MPMLHNGLAKLVEECGELGQVAGKMLQYPALQTAINISHPDGTFLRERIIEELGDVLAACEHVAKRLNLDWQRILERRKTKLALFEKWTNQP